VHCTQDAHAAENLGRFEAAFLVTNRKDEPMPTRGPDIDSDDTKEWMKPTKEKGGNAGVKPSRDISRQISAEQRRTANPSR
jgi:hypothetical protein